MSKKDSVKCDPASTGEPVARNDHLDPASTERPLARDVGIITHKIDFRIQRLPHSSVEEAEQERIRKLGNRIENHLHRDELQADLMQVNVYNPFSENSWKMIHDIGDVEYFELCETTSKVQCFIFYLIGQKALYTAHLEIAYATQNPHASWIEADSMPYRFRIMWSKKGWLPSRSSTWEIWGPDLLSPSL